ncbi:MAG TPA: FAD-dependent oxidoreductase [Candidatus Izemoplasmatales bacterium]|nr:FAD-dependent oxidoreductase [Bacillota bacterium]HRY77559.1 FAD-dependent oxidoreductase [Candidatus Izemoplasmatales bacterium]
MTHHDLVIVGCGPAGMMAAIYAKRANKDVLILDKSTPGGRIRSTYTVDNYLGFGRVSAEELVQKMVTHLHDLEIADTYGCVRKIDKTENGFIVRTDEEEYSANAVILATGTNPKTLGVENEPRFVGAGLSYCAVCDGVFFEDKDVVVIGGGDSALEESDYLSGICRSVTILHDLAEFTANHGLVKRVSSRPNVRIFRDTKVLGFLGDESIKGVRTLAKDGSEQILPAEGVFVYVGNQPDTGFVSGLCQTDRSGFIRVNSEMQTSVPGLYACGDVTKKDYRLIATAISDGAIAALGAVKYLDQLDGR